MTGKKLKIENGMTLLFQGDSITDVGRDRSDINSLGSGYVNFIKHAMLSDKRFSECRIINKGISGNRAIDLEARWETDCISLKPDILSVLIGVNDTWRRFDSLTYTPPEAYYKSYKNILEKALQANSKLQIVILEPFIIPSNPRLAHMRIDLDAKIEAARALSVECGTCYIPLDGLFAAAGTLHPPAHWSADGIHPTPEGHKLIAEAFMEIISLSL